MTLLTEVKMVLLPKETVSSKPFPLNGAFGILVLMPEGEDWGDQTERSVTLQAKSRHPGDENKWFTVQDPTTLIPITWIGEGFIKVEGVAGIEYRLHTTKKGCQASVYPVRNWVSRRPGR